MRSRPNVSTGAPSRVTTENHAAASTLDASSATAAREATASDSLAGRRCSSIAQVSRED